MQRRQLIATTICSSILLATVIFACSNVSAITLQDDSESGLRKARGRLISEGHNTTPVGRRKLLSYKLEELDLPQPKEIIANGKKRLVTTVLRLTIRGNGHQPNSAIWIDDVLFSSPWEVDGSSIATLIYDLSLLRDGATISVAADGQIYDLPEPLRLPASFKTSDDDVGSGDRITLRTLLRVNGNDRQRSVVVHLFTKPLPVINSSYSLQIGRKFFSPLLGTHNEYRVEMSMQDFAELKDGARVSINVGSLVVAYIGRLDKRMLDR
jgi:hypothetical protein